MVKSPVIVDDVSAGIDSLNGLPGTFIKFFEEKLGSGALWKLAVNKTDQVTVDCLVGYYDGEQFIFGEGQLLGKLVAPRGNNGFGFDVVIVPDGETRTMAEMTPAEKMQISHRGKAFRDLLEKLKVEK